MTTAVAERGPINWPATLVLTLTPLAALIALPLYVWFNDFSTAAWIACAVVYACNGLSITGGYHRLWSHRTYEAHWSLRLFFMLFGAMAIQNSILIWSSKHRTHHRHVDAVDDDPYSINRGFFFAHMGWMLRDSQTCKLDLGNAKDLQQDRIVMFQHTHYLAIVLAMNIGFPLALGWLLGDVWGVFLLAGLLRLVLSHHATFFINSLCHMWGSRPYTDDNTARDNVVLAMLTWGEGYHNYHHIFQYDYRNGVKWWQFDPTKWLILTLSWVGLTQNLKRSPGFAIQKAQLTMEFKHAEQKIARRQARQADVEALKAKLAHEYETFTAALHDWAKVKEEEFTQKKAELQQKWEVAKLHQRCQELEARLRQQRRRLRALTASA